ncbi:MAG: glycosyltransferase [Acetobacteraceae bacterium]
MDQVVMNPAREERLKRNLEYLIWRLRAGEASEGLSPGPRGATRTAAVVCWDLSHNPAGRAYVLARLLGEQWLPELVGPIWPRFGRTLWEPLRASGLPWHALHVENLLDLVVQASALSLARQYDLVVVSKPRLPGLLLGLFLAEQSRCPLIFDFDEDERAFLQYHLEHPSESATKLLAEPFGTTGTLLASQYWSMADAVTVASPVLRKSFGGSLVRHARDETAPVADRTAARQRLGYRSEDFVLAFIGTVRAHKGIDRILSAMEAIDDPRLKLLVVGSIDDPAVRARLATMPERVQVFPPCDIARLGTYLAAADLVPLLQKPEAVIAQSQFPAKVTDALQHGVPIVATATPPLSDGSLGDAVDWISPDGLRAYLASRLRAAPITQERRARIRQIFEDEYSERVNRVRLEAAVQTAGRQSHPFGRAKSEALRGLLDAVRRAQQESSRSSLALPAIASPRTGYDVAFFWKQNDSDLFGRRSDLMARHLPRTGLIRRVVHFDHVLPAADFARMARDQLAGRQNIPAMQFRTQALRALRLSDTQHMTRRVVLTEASQGAPSFGGEPHHAVGRVPELVASMLREAGCCPTRTIAWVCPVVWPFPEIAAEVPFHRVVVDLVDDQRTWARTPEEWQRVHDAYARTLRLADLVLTNAEGNRANFADLHSGIHVVPNGAELDGPPDGTVVPDILRTLRRPLIGYCGNLSERIDWSMVQALAQRHPAWSFVMIGPRGDAGIPAAITECANVTLPGPLPYDVARRCIAEFDCAILPHVTNAMTDAMNPLKVYNYLGMGVPVVATPVANLEGLDGLITVAHDADAFSAAIAAVLAAPVRRSLSPDEQDRIAWESRMRTITELLEATLR